MGYAVVHTDSNGKPHTLVLEQREWLVQEEPVRWFERVNWWEQSRRMPRGLSRMDVEVWQLQIRLGRNNNSALRTVELERDQLGGSWHVRPELDRSERHGSQRNKELAA
ncbi:hypothetical protein ACQR35_04805 [Pseudarthrobacter sp. J1738]|uniref:hypothetical protein n=1 Tax=unclassified Pseudarthrobacter TaxID=2647000 RepID=UPI003D2D4F9E